MDFIQAVIKPSYWLTHQYPVPPSWQLALTILFATLLGLGLFAVFFSTKKKYRKPYRRFLAKLAVAFLVLGMWGYLQLFFSVQRIGYLSARFFYLLWFIVAVIWLYKIAKYLFKDVPRLVKMQDEIDAKAKYLPTRKK